MSNVCEFLAGSSGTPTNLALSFDPDLPPTKREAALALAQEAGVGVFPCQADGKAPVTSDGFKSATTNLEQIKQWWPVGQANEAAFNVGIYPEASGLAIIDVDSQKDTFNPAELEALKLPPTFTVQTPNGGTHYYFFGSLPPSANKLAKAVDTRGRGSYVLAPGSVIDGQPYLVKNNLPVALLPEEIERRLNAVADRKTSDVRVELDSERAIAKGIEHLKDLVKKGDVAVSGENGNTKMYSEAAKLRGLGLSPHASFQLLSEMYNPACIPPWDNGDLWEFCFNAEKYAQNDAGTELPKLPSETFKGVELPNGMLQSAPLTPKLLEAAETLDFEDEEDEPFEWLIPDFIEKGQAVALSGIGGSNKSRLAMQLGLCLHAGVPIFGKDVEKAEFVYFSYEDSRSSVKRRCKAMKKKLNLPAELGARYFNFAGQIAPLLVIDETQGVTFTPLWQEVGSYLKAIAGHKFVVFDSTYQVLDFRGSSKINEGCVMMALNCLSKLCEDTDSTILYLWHPSHTGVTRGDSSGWSVAWNNRPRGRLSLTPEGDGVARSYRLKVEKLQDGPAGHSIELEYSDGILERVGQRTTDLVQYGVVLEAAKLAAERGEPFVRNGNHTSRSIKQQASSWHMTEINSRFPEMTPKTVRMFLDKGCAEGRLTYLSYDQAPGRKAGYYETQHAESSHGLK